MRSFCQRLVITMVILASVYPVAAAKTKGLPPGLLPDAKSIQSVERLVMPEFDVSALLAEDTLRESSGRPVPYRFAQGIDVALTPHNSGSWETLADGSKLWRIRIASPGALTLSLGLEHFAMPAGAKLWIHDTNGAWVQGPYTRKDRNAAGGLWTAMIRGDELIVEVHTRANIHSLDIRITSINHGYRSFDTPETGIEAKQGSCNIDVICPQGDLWRDQIRSVARISYISGGQGYLCTAQLINNTAEDDTPYLLTAEHCIDAPEAAPTIVAYWNYQSSICGALSGGNLSDNQSGATLVSSWSLNAGSDFALVELDQVPDSNSDVYFSGWDAGEAVPQAAVGIHHPSGNEKAISFEEDPLFITSLDGTVSPGDGNYFRVTDWDEGTTEGGSSGSCLFDATSQLCVGTLTGGSAACGNNLSDWYGRMNRHYSGGGTPQSRLSDWLDPLGTGATSLQGKNPEKPASTYTWLIPAAASNTGKEDSVWKSEIAVPNSGSESRSASVYFVPEFEPWPGELLSGPHTINPNESLHVDDPLLAQNPIAGLMYITVDGEGTTAYSRLYNQIEDGTTFGQGMPGILLEATKSATELVLPLVHSEPGRFRTNVGLVQASAGSFRVEISIYSTSGTLLAQKRYSSAAAWRQINDIFKNMGIGDQVVQGGWIRVKLINGSPAFWTTYATVTDNETNDPTYIQPVAP